MQLGAKAEGVRSCGPALPRPWPEIFVLAVSSRSKTALEDPVYANSSLKDNNTHAHPFNGPLSGTTQVSLYQKVETNLDFTEARDSEWQWHQLGHVQACTSLQTDDHASTPPLSFLQAECFSCHPTNSIIALKAHCRIIARCISLMFGNRKTRT